jgi:hypothetical protein
MKTLLLLVISLLPSLAQAGTLTDKAYQVAAQLGTRESSLSPAQQAAVNHQLDSILASLQNQPAPGRLYICVSRDNDNNRPFVLAYKGFADVTRIPGAVFNSKEDCEASLQNGQAVGDRYFACASRDNDGSHPFKIVSLNGTTNALMLQRSILSTLDDCFAATRAMQVRPEGVLYCGSRDNDGSSPFAQTGYKYDGSYVQSREDYRSLSDCTSAM